MVARERPARWFCSRRCFCSRFMAFRTGNWRRRLRPSVVPALCRARAERERADHTVLARFRNLLVGEGLLETLFGELDRQLEKAELELKRGTMLDATLIEAVSAPPSGERLSKDPDARFTKRQGKAGSPSATRRMSGWTKGRADPLGDHDAGQCQRHLACRRLIVATSSVSGRTRLSYARPPRAAEGRGQEGAHRAPAQQASSRTAGSSQALQLSHRASRAAVETTSHSQTAHEARHDPLCRPGQGERTGADGRDRLQHAKMGGAHAIVAPAIERDRQISFKPGFNGPSRL